MYEIYKIKDIYIPMRDGIRLIADVYRPNADGKFPALLAFQPWGKDHDAMGQYFPPQRRPNPLWDGSLEGGNTRYLVSHGYAHVVVDARGTGNSEGELTGIMGAGVAGEGNDLYDVIEWIAKQDWCDGNVGMVGISYLAAVQVIAAAQQPPHLKAIFPEGGHYDIYRHIYHGGIMWLMPRAAMEGRGGDGYASVRNPKALTKDILSKEEFKRRIQERLEDPDVKNYPNFQQILSYPESRPIWLDYIINPCDDEFYWGEGKAEEKYKKIKIPAHFAAQWGRGWQIEETINAYLSVQGPKWLVLRPGPPMQERPFHEFHDEIVRWYDYWLKGIDNGVKDEPTIKIFVNGVDEWRYEEQWPIPQTKWEKFFLRSGHRLLKEPESFTSEIVPPDGYYQAPLTVTNIVGKLTYKSNAFMDDTEVIGPAALYLYAMIDTEDTNWIVTIYDIDPNGKRLPLTNGFLKASHREIDESKSTPQQPYHPHIRAVPVMPGEITEYQIAIYPLANVFRKGHYLEVEIKSIESPIDVNIMLPPESIHLNSARATTHKIYRDKDYQSHLLLPITPK